MDLSHWMEPDRRFLPGPRRRFFLGGSGRRFEEMNRRVLSLVPNAFAPSLHIDRCLGADDARAQLRRSDVLGAYCLTLAQGQKVHGLEAWTEDSAPPDGRDEMLVCVSVRKEAGGLDLLRSDVGEAVLKVLVQLRNEGVWGGENLSLRFSRENATCLGDLIWTPELSGLYREEHDERFLDRLPLLWFDGPGSETSRLRFRGLVADLFENRFLQTLSAWAEGEGVRIAGSFDPDGSTIDQALFGWGPSGRFFQSISTPGVTGGADATQSAFSCVQAASVAQQLHAPHLAPERRPELPSNVEYEVYPDPQRHDVLAELGREMQSALVMGAGQLVTPDPESSLRGEGKRLHGPALFHKAQPWWPLVNRLYDCVGRLNDLLSQGVRRTQVLLLVPSDTYVALCASPLPANLSGLTGKPSEFNAAAQEFERFFQQIISALVIYQIDFAVADEDLIERHGRPEANTFFLGDGEYTTVVVPPALSWRGSVAKKLRRFSRRGGSLILAKPLAERIGVEETPFLEELEDQYANVHCVERAGREVCFQLNRIEPSSCQFKTGTGENTDALLLQSRQTATHEMFCVMNTARDQNLDARVFLYADGAVRVMDAWAPRTFVRDSEEERNAQAFDFTFSAGEATLFAVGGESDLTEPPYQRLPHATREESLEKTWRFERRDPNVMPLRSCRWSLAGENPSRQMPVEFARVEVRKAAPASGTRLRLEFEFDSAIDGEGRQVGLVIEPNEGMEIRFNKEPISLDGGKPLFDEVFKSVEVGAHLRVGPNRVEIAFPMSDSAIIEMPFLAGDFAVSVENPMRPVLTEEPAELKDGSWIEQGYPYYAGRMVYRQDVFLVKEANHRYFLALRKPSVAGLTVRMGKHEPVFLHCHPHRLEITRLAIEGDNPVEIEVYSSLHNLFGPVHLAPRLIERKMPVEAWDEIPAQDRRQWNQKPSLAAFGLMGGAVLEDYDPAALPPKPAEKKPEKSEGDEESGAEEEGGEGRDT
ncbi:hypothetical protein HQ520_08085 [bacterium]|nr:hypothetical protein [bacterium]